MPSYALVVSTATTAIRRVIADDDGNVSVGLMPDGTTHAVICTHPHATSSYHPILAGETAFAVPVSGTGAGAHGPANWDAVVNQKYGAFPPKPTCALVNAANMVVGVVQGEVGLDVSPTTDTMIQCYAPGITVGCTYDPASGLFSTPGGTIPPNTPGNSTGSPITVPPQVIPKP